MIWKYSCKMADMGCEARADRSQSPRNWIIRLSAIILNLPSTRNSKTTGKENENFESAKPRLMPDKTQFFLEVMTESNIQEKINKLVCPPATVFLVPKIVRKIRVSNNLNFQEFVSELQDSLNIKDGMINANRRLMVIHSIFAGDHDKI